MKQPLLLAKKIDHSKPSKTFLIMQNKRQQTGVWELKL